jgi:hypothetical protein
MFCLAVSAGSVHRIESDPHLAGQRTDYLRKNASTCVPEANCQDTASGGLSSGISSTNAGHNPIQAD